MIWLRTLMAMAFCGLGVCVTAQTSAPATLVADQILIQADSRLVARGNVDIWQGEAQLTARSVVFDRNTGALVIEGPLILRRGTQAVVLASSAELDADLRNGILRGARLVLNEQLQIAAGAMARTDGRYNQLFNVAATSCHICENGRPIWQIRASRIVHDEQARQLYFDHAQLAVFDVPVFYLPRLRLPDPTLERANGVLVPRIKSNTQLGVGLKVPYFFRLGDHADLTLTPYLSSATRTLEWRYRQAFANGDIAFTGAYSKDDLLPGQSRAYTFGDGRFDIGRGFDLTFSLRTAEDASYLQTYGYSDLDRLTSELAVSRTRYNRYETYSVTAHKSLRSGEDNATLPTLATDGTLQQRFWPEALGGEGLFNASFHTHYRWSDSNSDGPDPDLIADGRDIARFSMDIGWHRSWVHATGLELTVDTQLSYDAYAIDQDASFSPAVNNFSPAAQVTLRWPFLGRTSRASHVFEPVLSYTYTGDFLDPVPNEDSTRVEFDEGNLFSLSRAPGVDIRERGARLDAGLTWTRFGDNGVTSRLTLGRVFRADNPNSFSLSSGLSDGTSDWLVAGSMDFPNRLNVMHRSLFGTGLSKSETRLGYQVDRLKLDLTHVWLPQDPDEERTGILNELAMDASYQLTPYWSSAIDYRYDFDSNSLAQAGLNLTFKNECVDMTFSAKRRYTTSGALQPSTDFGFKVGFRGFGISGKDNLPQHRCG